MKNQATKDMIKTLNSLSDGEPADVLVALYYLSINWRGGQFTDLYTVAHLTGYSPNYQTFDGEDETVHMLYDEMEYAEENKKSINWVFITEFFNRKYNQRSY